MIFIFKFVQKNISDIIISFVITLLLKTVNEYLTPINILLSNEYADILKAFIMLVLASIGFMIFLFIPLSALKRNADNKSFISYYFQNGDKSKFPFDVTVVGSMVVGLIFILLSIFLLGKSILSSTLLGGITFVWVFAFVLYLFLGVRAYNIITVLLFKNTVFLEKVSNEPTKKDREEYNKNIPKK